MENKPDIKIFVSHRIDLDSETIDNPLYLNVRCGAVFDKRKNVTMLGDDTGDNISEKRDSFCELTVMYWAWKNVKADYYGLCHYRRYLSFSEEKYETNDYGVIESDCINENNINKFCLKEDIIRNELDKGYDLITAQSVDVRNLNPAIHCILYYCKLANNDFNINDIEILLDFIKCEYPDFYLSAVDYYKQPYARWYNCFIIKRELYNEICNWIFKILFELEKKLDFTNYSKQKHRELGFFGEHLYGIYVNYLINKKIVKYKELQIAFFNDTNKLESLSPLYLNNSIAIVLLVSDYYVPYTCVLLSSLIDNISNKKNYEVIICEKNISNHNKKKLKKFFDSNNRKLRFLNMSSVFSSCNLYIAAEHYSEEAYYRMLIPWCLNGYNKVIVMDSDIIVKNDISDLYNIDIQDKCIGAVRDVFYQGMLNKNDFDLYKYCSEEMGMKNPYGYVNTGVMLMNLERIRHKVKKEWLLDYISTHKFRIQEQDIINVIYEDEIKNIDIKYNYYLPVNDMCKLWLSYAPKYSAEEYEKNESKAVILHWANVNKPWIDTQVLYADIWWFYAKNTAFYEIILQRMMENMIAKSIMPRLSVPLITRLTDKCLPRGTMRRELLKKIMPRGSWQFEFLRKIYHRVKL